MDIFGFFDYKPKDFVNKSVNDILDMKQSKVKENFEKKYEANEVYMNEITEDQKKAIFLLRVLKKGLSKEDKDNTLSLCNIENDNSPFKTRINKSMGEPSIKEDRNTSRRSMSPGNKSASSHQIEDEEPPKETSMESEEVEGTEEQPQQEGGKKHKKRKTNRKRKGKKRTQKRKY